MGFGKSFKKAFKSVKKVVKTTAKVATLGAVDGKNGGWLGGTDGVLNVFSLGTVGEGPLSNPLMPKTPEINIPDMSTTVNVPEAQFIPPDPTSLEGVLANVDLGDAGDQGDTLSLDPYRPSLKRKNTGISGTSSVGGTGVKV